MSPVFSSPLSLSVFLLFFLLQDFHSHTWSQHFLTFLGLCHPRTLSPHLPQWDLGNYYGPPSASSQERKKQIPAPISLTKGPNSHSPGQAVSHCSELTGGVGGDSVGEVGVPLISRASTFYSLRQFWLPLFGCQCKSGGSGAIVSSRERTEQIGCTEQKERSQAVALLPCR